MAVLQLQRATRAASQKVACTCTPAHRSPACLQRSPGPSTALPATTRRDAVTGLLALSGGLLLQGQLPLAAAAAAKAATQVGAYLPNDEAAGPGFVRYTPDNRKTPALRAGVIKPNPDYYSFVLPETWSEGLITNPQSGVFCMPRCDEPWVEAIFQEDKEGWCQLVVSPLFRLVSKAKATVRDVGPPEGVVESVGNFITGNYLSEDDVTSMKIEKLADGREAYVYEVYAPYAQHGGHILACFTVKADAAYLFVVSANDKQWAQSQPKLRKMLQSFQA